MSLERSIETIEKFPVDPDGHIVYIVYNEDMVNASESLITEVHGQEYFDKHVNVSFIGGKLPDEIEGKRCLLYFDPAVHNYIGNGQN